MSVVDISSLRLIANVVEKDLRLVGVGDPAMIEVDAFPGEKFTGRIARVAPILDPATRTAPMEVEIPNRDFRLKPGMYAKVNLEIEGRKNVLLVPKIALVDSEGQRGVYQPSDDSRASFKMVKVGIEDAERAEILEGLSEGETIVSVGAGALRRNDQLVVAGQQGATEQRGSSGRPAGQGGRPGMGDRQRGDGPSGEARPNRQPGGQEPSGQPGRLPQTRRQLQQRPVA